MRTPPWATGILPGSAQFIFDSGADVITLGNHGLRRREIYPMLEENEFLLRPANYHPSAPGRGSVLLDMGAAQVGIISLQRCRLYGAHCQSF